VFLHRNAAEQVRCPFVSTVPKKESVMPQSNMLPTFVATAPGEALAQFRSEIDAMPDTDVVTVRVDVTASALTAVGSMPEIEAHRAAILSVFGLREGETLDRLVPLAHALLAAQASYLLVADVDLEPMAQELMQVRTRLFIAASALIQRKLVQKKALASLIGGQSYQGRVMDTIMLVHLFHGLPADVRASTRVDDAEITRAVMLAQQFGNAVALREQARVGTSQPARDRARVFTLFFDAYERIRQMLTYLRWHQGDVEQIAPSLFARGPRKRDTDDGDDGTRAGTGHPPTGAPTGNPVPPGMPGANPFTS
jgi:hypothetical protein